jgi:hypothetical protein
MSDERDEGLTDMLRRENATYLPDDGFTDQVLGRLPRRRARAGQRSRIVLGFALLACLLTTLVLTGGDLRPSAVIAVFASAPLFSCLPLVSLVAAVVVAAVGLAVTSSD